jgi:hypothetical protein
MTDDRRTALGTTIVDPTGVVTIHDDDPVPTVAIRDTGRREVGVEAHAVVVSSAPSGRTVVVHDATHDGSARAGIDYLRIPGGARPGRRRDGDTIGRDGGSHRRRLRGSTCSAHSE